MTEQELLEELERSIESNNRNNLDLIKVLNGTDTQDVTLQDGSVVPSLSKRIQAEVVEDSNYLFKSDNLASVENKQTARTNLGVPSVTEMNTAITNATPNATETVAGKAKIATTAIAQAGLNDTDFITPKKLLEFIKSNVIKNDFIDVKSSRVQGVVYTNPSSSSYLNVRINATVPVSGFVEAYVSDKLEMKTVTSGGGSWGEYIFILVPPLGTYKLVAAGASISYWGEA